MSLDFLLLSSAGVDLAEIAKRYIQHRERHHLGQQQPVASHDRPTGPGQSMDPQHVWGWIEGGGGQKQRHQRQDQRWQQVEKTNRTRVIRVENRETKPIGVFKGRGKRRSIWVGVVD